MEKLKQKIFFCIYFLLIISVIFSLKVKAYDEKSVLNDLAYLESLAESYKNENDIYTDTKLLVSTYIRNGAYDDNWNQYGGNLDENFETYVQNNSSNLSYLKNVYQITMSSGDTIDFKRLISDLNILINKGSLFGGWISDIYDLAILIPSQNISSEEIAKNYYNSFSSSTCLTNIDAFNIYKKYGNSLSKTIESYYSSINNDERFSQFVNNIGVSNISKESIRISVLANFKNCSQIENLLNLKGISLESNNVQGAAYAYADYIYSKHPNRTLINEINFNTEDFYLNVGEEKELNITTNPEIDINLLNLTSSSPEVISIISNKKIKAISEGTSKLTCSYGTISKTLNITVIGKIDKIEFNEDIIKIEAGSATKIEPIVTPSNNKNYIFASSNPEIADVDKDGNIFSFKAGKTYITCKSAENPSIFAKCELIITQNIQEIIINNPEIRLAKGESCKLGLTISPEKHSDKLIYSSSDESVAKVNTQGNITAEKVGEAIITCMSEENNEIKAECKVIVTKSIERIQFEKSFQTVEMNKTPTLKLNVFLTPSTANVSNLIFEISDKSIATLDSSTMTLTFLKKGSFSITCKSKEDETVIAKCNFYVMNSEENENKVTPTSSIKYDKEDEINVEEIIDKGDTTVLEKEESLFSSKNIKIIILAFIIISVIVVLTVTIIIEMFRKNKDKIFKGLGFNDDFEEEEEDENYYKEIDEDPKFHNTFKVFPQTEEESLKLKYQLEDEYKKRNISYEEIEKEMEDIKKNDLNDK